MPAAGAPSRLPLRPGTMLAGPGRRPKGEALLQVVISGWEEDRFLHGLSGLLRTAHLENPQFFGQLIELSGEEPIEGVRDKIRESSRASDEPLVRYANGRRMALSWL